MKKFIVFGLAILSLISTTSCQKDDDVTPTEENNDPFIGSWQLTKSINNGNEITLETCDLLNKMVVRSDGRVELTDWYTNEETGNCESDLTVNEWEKLGNNSYELTFEDPEDPNENLKVEVLITFTATGLEMEVVLEDGEIFVNHFSKI